MILDSLHALKRIHLVGICGTGMASLAGMLHNKGFHITGSDQNVYPPMSIFLKKLGISVLEGFTALNLKPHPDLVVIGNVASRGNPEVELTLNEKIPYVSMAEIVKDVFIRGKKSVVVTGTHGKTTTTALLAWILEYGGLHPSFMLGGIAENFESSFQVTDSNYFVIEGDEYDTAFFDKGPKFLHYLPEVVIFNNCEFDHADIYPNFAAVQQSFSRLINIIPSKGALIAGWDNKVVQNLSAQSLSPVISFGTQEGAQWTACSFEYLKQSTRFQVIRQGKLWEHIEIPLAGIFNVRNALAAIICANHFGLTKKIISQALLHFKGVKRRLELRGKVRDIMVFDDFAHHPSAIEATLTGVKARFPKNRIWAIFEPRSATSRRKVFQKQFSQCFSQADHVILCSIFAPERLSPNFQLSLEQLVNDLRKKDCQVNCYSSANEIVEHVAPKLLPRDIVIIMSNGGFDDIHTKLLDALN